MHACNLSAATMHPVLLDQSKICAWVFTLDIESVFIESSFMFIVTWQPCTVDKVVILCQLRLKEEKQVFGLCFEHTDTKLTHSNYL